MKRTILRYAALLALLGAAPHLTRAAGEQPAAAPTLRTIAPDSLQRLCGGRLPLYAAGSGLWLEIPSCELRLTVQLDRGAGMRNRALPSLPPFRLEADTAGGVARLWIADTLKGKAFATTPLPLARMAGTERLLADISRCLLDSGRWYDCSEGILRNRRYGSESLLGVDTTACGSLLRIGVCYDVESPERSTEIQMPSGALPLEIGILMTTEECPARGSAPELVVAPTLPKEYADALRQAVKEYNRRHRQIPLRAVAGGEVIPVTSPYGISYDVAQERIDIRARRSAIDGRPEFVRINLGTGSWEQESLRHALQSRTSYRTLRRRLADVRVRRRDCLEARFTQMLEEAFAADGEAIRTAPQEKRPNREFRDVRRQLSRWERFMRKQAPRLAAGDTEIPAQELYEAMQAEVQRLYIHLAESTRESPFQGEILHWIARGLIADAEGRFATPLLRNNALTASPRMTARRQQTVWRGVLAAAAPESLADVPELFGRLLDEHGEAACAMQDTFVGELLRQAERHPQFAATAEALETCFETRADGSGSFAALFAEIERQRLEKWRTENQKP